MSAAGQLQSACVGDFVTFAEERRKYQIRARGDRYMVCTKPFFKSVIYSVIDLVENVRGTENLVFGFGAETDEQCREMVARLEDPSSVSEVSRRNRVPLHVKTIWLMPRAAK